MLKYNVLGNKNGEVIVFINGAGIGPWMWNNQVDYFTDNKCITFDLPGHGANNDIEFTTIEECSKAIAEIIMIESKSRIAIMIGHSIGAQIIMYMIENHVQVISKAIIVSGLNKPMPFVHKLMKPMITWTMPLIRMRSFSKLQAAQLSIPDEMFETYYQDSMKISKNTLRNILFENSNLDFNNKSNAKVDSLILVGDREKSIMRKSAMKTKSVLNNSIGYIIKIASHDIPYKQSDLFNHLVECFISGKEMLYNNLIEL